MIIYQKKNRPHFPESGFHAHIITNPFSVIWKPQV